LRDRGINSIVFIPDEGLRSLPLAALHDGEKFLVETYSVALMPSFSLTNTDPVDIQQAQVLAMGVSEFTDLSPSACRPCGSEKYRRWTLARKIFSQ
jgi:CHAT domain-containing protein